MCIKCEIKNNNFIYLFIVFTHRAPQRIAENWRVHVLTLKEIVL